MQCSLPLLQQSLHAEIKQRLLSSNKISSNHTLQEFFVPTGSHPHDVAPSADGRTIWYTAQALGQLRQLDPKTGRHTIWHFVKVLLLNEKKKVGMGREVENYRVLNDSSSAEY